MVLSPKDSLPRFLNFVNVVPQELLYAIFQNVPFKERIACMGVCKAWYSALADCQSLWTSLSVNRTNHHHFDILPKSVWRHALRVDLSRLTQPATSQLLRPSLIGFGKLRYFKLEHCTVDSTLLCNALACMLGLESLSIHYCGHDKVLFALDLLVLCPNLHALSHCGTQTSKRIQDRDLQKCSNLRSLTVVHEETQEPLGFYAMITKILRQSRHLRNIYFRFRLDPIIYQSIVDTSPQLETLEVRDRVSDRFSATVGRHKNRCQAASPDSAFGSVSCSVRCHGHIQLEQFLAGFIGPRLSSIRSLKLSLFSNTIITPLVRLDSILRQDNGNSNQIIDLDFESIPANAAGCVASIIRHTPLLRLFTMTRSTSILSTTSDILNALRSCMHLHTLSISACRIHTTGLYDLLEHHRRNGPTLKKVLLDCISGLDDRTLWAIASLLGLQTLSLYDVSSITESGMQECINRLSLLSTCKELRLRSRTKELAPKLAHTIASIQGIETISIDYVGSSTVETVRTMFGQSLTLKTVIIIQPNGSGNSAKTFTRDL